MGKAPHDSETTVAELREAVRLFEDARPWEKYHRPKNLAMSIAIEAAELMEHFQWITVEQSKEYVSEPGNLAAVTQEIADIVIYLLSFANQAGIDLTQAVMAKLRQNDERYPVDRCEDMDFMSPP